MTISTTIIKNSFSGNGSTTAFNYGFKITAESEMQVIIRSSTGSETVKTLSSHYTISGVGAANGGAVTFTSGNIPASGETVILRRVTAQTQAMDLIDNDPMSADTIETAHDKSIALIQELQEQLNRSLKVSRTATLTTPEITDDAAARAGKLLGFSADGNSLDATIDGSGVAVSATAAANSATAAASSASAASSSATSAENAKNAAEAALDTFDDDFLGSKSSNPSVDNDGNSLADGALYFDTTNNVMKVYDLGNTQWKQLTPTSSQQTNIDAAVSNATNINHVGGSIGNVNTVAGQITPTNNIATLAGISGLNTLAGSAASVIAAGNNLSDINAFANIYLGPSSSAPSADPDGSALDVGDLYFDTTSDTLKVYKSGGWAAAGSTVNGTSKRYIYNITGTPTTLTGASGTGYAEATSQILSYDSGFVDIFHNGVKMILGTDVTATSGNSLVFASALANGDVVDVVAYGTFELANVQLNDLTDVSTGGVSDGQVLVYNSGNSRFQPGSASSAEVYGFKKTFVGSTLVKTVTVVSVGGSNKYFIDGVQQDTLELYEGNTYIFNYPSAHPFKFSTTSNGTHASGSEYTTGVTHNSSTQVTIVVATGAPTLYYYCSSHSNMGGTANTPTPGPNNLQVTTTNKGADNIDSSTYAAFDDVLFSASGFTFSISNGILIATI